MSIESAKDSSRLQILLVDDSPMNLDTLLAPWGIAFYITKEDGKGTGLGLSICHDILQKHQGTVAVASEMGEGTYFTIKRPMVAM